MTGSPPSAILPEPLTVLYEQSGAPRHPLPAPLARAYGGDLGFPELCVYGNFVASLDGVVALGREYPSSGSAISGREPADRFVMGLLRAFADAVLIGAGTLRATPNHRWTPEHVCPRAAAGFAALRGTLGCAPAPELIVVTASGDLPLEHAALQKGAVIVTTARGERRLDGHLPEGCTLLAIGTESRVDVTAVLAAIRRRGHTIVLTEGGPHLLGQLIDVGVLNELFLTVAPVLAGRAVAGRPGLISGIELLPWRRDPVDLISARCRASYLFLRYRLGAAASRAAPATRSGPH